MLIMTKEEEAIKKEMEEAIKSETSEDENKEEDADEADDAKESEKESEEGKDDSLKIEKTDYDAELTKERSRREEAERKLEETRRKAKERYERKHKEGVEEDDEDRPPTISEFRAMLSEEREATRKELQSQRILEHARKLASSESEAQLIVEIHKNRSFPSGLSTEEQVEESYAIANRKQILAQNEELKRSIRSKETRNRSSSGGFHDSAMKPEEPKIGSADIGAIKAVGFEWDGTKRLYKKPIAGGKKYLYFDPKTKKRFVR